MPHWKKAFNPDYLGAYSLEPGKDMVLTIKSVGIENVTGEGGKKEDCLVCHFVENAKPMILNKTNCKTISKLYKSPDYDTWCNNKIQLFQDVTKLKGELVECLRIRPSIPKCDFKKIICTKCNNQIMARGNMSAENLATYTEKKYGIVMCADCASKYKQELCDTRKDELNENNQNQN